MAQRKQDLRAAFVHLKQNGKQIGDIASLFKDGATLHTALLTQQWLRRNVPDFIAKHQWPPRSPDLNPLDYSVWSILEARVCQQSHSSLESLKASLQQEWNAMDLETIKRIVDDFPRRVDACIAAGGNHFE